MAGVFYPCGGSVLEPAGSVSKPVYINDNGEPVACTSLDPAVIAGKSKVLVNAEGTPYDVGSTNYAVKFVNGVPVAQEGTLANSISGNAATATTASKLGSNAGSSTQPIYFSNGVPAACGTTLGTDSAKINITGNAATATTATNATNVNIADDTSSKIYVLGATGPGNTRIYRESSVYMQNNVLYGACWNDYAEFRVSDGVPG